MTVGLAFAFNAFAQPGSTGFQNPAISENNLSVGVISFLLPNNVKLSDNSYSTVTATILNQITHYVVASDFGMAVPSNATITGVEISVEKSGIIIGNAIVDNSVRLFYNGSIIGNDKASGSSWPVSDGLTTYGSSSDNWGASLTPAIVNSPTFGFGISARLGGIGLPLARLDHIQMNIHYSVPLPVGFDKVQAFATDGGVKVQWSTITEFNNSHFDVQHSKNGQEWDVLGSVTGAGTSSDALYYSFRDQQNTSGYYRIKQVDFDGNYSFSEIVFALENSLEDVEQSDVKLRYYAGNKTLRIHNLNDISAVYMSNSLGEFIQFDINKLDSNIWDIQMSEGLKSNLFFIEVIDLNGHITNKSVFIQE